MPKAKTRKRRTVKSSARVASATTQKTTGAQADAGIARQTLPDTRGLQSLVMSALVALGCWAFAYYTFLFNRDANSALFAGMAALLALIWSISFFVRLRKWRRRR